MRGPLTSHESQQLLQRKFLQLFRVNGCTREEAITRTAKSFRVDRKKVAILVDRTEGSRQ